MVTLEIVLIALVVSLGSAFGYLLTAPAIRGLRTFMESARRKEELAKRPDPANDDSPDRTERPADRR